MKRKEKKPTKKEPAENYPTPYNLAKAICQRTYGAFSHHGYTFLEPSCGSGTLVRAIREVYGPEVLIEAVDPHARYQAQVTKAGANQFYPCTFEKWISKSETRPRIIIGNPPFSLAKNHLELLFHILPRNSWVVFLLRLSFMSGLDRTKEFWDYRGLPYLEWMAPITPRPSFVKGSSDNSEYGLFAWLVGNQGANKLETAVVWEKS